MGFLDELKDKASSALDAAKIVGEKAVEKGKDMAQQGKLGFEIMTLENKVKDLKVDLAEFAITRSLFKEDEELKTKLKEIEDLTMQIANKQTEIELLK